MILSKLVVITVKRNKNLQHYLDLEYKCELRVPFEVKVKDLRRVEKVVIKCKCEKCGKIKHKSYRDYLKNAENYYFSCSIKCSNDKIKLTTLERYGVENALQSKEIKDKIQKTNLEKYGNVCSLHGKDIKEKTKETCLERYRTNYPTQSKEFKEKYKKTCLERYGVENVFESDIIKNKIKKTNLERYYHENSAHGKESKEKIKKTNLERYGTKNVFESDIIKNKIKKTNLERYGYEHPVKSDIIKDRIKKTCLYKYNVDQYFKSFEYKKILIEKKKDKFINKFNIKETNIINVDFNYIEIKCDKCNKLYKEDPHFIHKRIMNKKEPCTNCNPHSSITSASIPEKELVSFIMDNYNDSIIVNSRKIINPYELDIYLPNLNIAFEFNGVYWHNELYKDKMYHLNKTNICLNKNIKLIHIYEDDWNNKKPIVKSIILDMLNMHKYNIDIDKCVLKELNYNESSKFLIENNIENSDESDIRVGSYYNNVLVSLMTFRVLNKSKNIYELLSFCNSLNTNINKADLKLFEYFKINYFPKAIISYIDRGWCNGELYYKLGFKHKHNTDPYYAYVINGVRGHRIKQINENALEYKNMLKQNIYRIYDSGLIKAKWS